MLGMCPASVVIGANVSLNLCGMRPSIKKQNKKLILKNSMKISSESKESSILGPFFDKTIKVRLFGRLILNAFCMKSSIRNFKFSIILCTVHDNVSLSSSCQPDITEQQNGMT